MSTVQIRSVENLMVFMALVGDNPILWDTVDTATLKAIVPVAIQGPTRDGRTDIKGADFIADLQRQTNKAFQRYGDTTLGGRGNYLRVEVKEGSDWLNVDYGPALKEAVKKMTPKQIIGTVCFAAILGAGVYCYGSFQDTEVARIKAEVERVRMEHREVLLRDNNEHHERLMAQLLKSNAEIVAEAVQLAKNVAVQEANEGRDASKPIRKYV
jgi:hypothetical protein